MRDGIPWIDNRPALRQKFASRALRKAQRVASSRSWGLEVGRGFVAAIKECQPDVILAQYGPTACKILSYCRRLNIPLVTHFHGFDASRYKVLADYKHKYKEFFQASHAVIAVSKLMST